MIRLDNEELSMWAEETQGVNNETLTIRELSLDNGREVNLLNGKKKNRRMRSFEGDYASHTFRHTEMEV